VTAGPAHQGLTDGRAAALAFLTAFVTLFVQVLVHRVVSAKLLNNYAFLIISLTMLGFALSGVVLTRWLHRFLARFADSANLCAALFVVTLVAATLAMYHTPLGQQLPVNSRAFLASFARWSPLALLFAVPFVFCGLVLGSLLSAPGLAARRVYFFDLLGSALGAFLVIPAISAVGVENSLLGGAALMLAGTAVLAPPRARGAWTAVAGAGAVLALCAAFPARAFEMTYPEGSMLAAHRDPRGRLVIEHTSWDPLARIEVSRISPPSIEQHLYPSLIGPNPDFHARFQRMLTQNNYAFTYAVNYDGRPESLRGIEHTIYAAAYMAGAQRAPRVMIIGVGGGFDVLTALRFEPTSVTGVEINGATVEILKDTYREYFQHWVNDPRVRIVHGEGRHHLAAQGGEYDVIQLSGVDSYSGTPGAAHVFSENFLYTAEAFDLYLRHLGPNGIINMMRLEFAPAREMLRALVTATAALRRAGVTRPADHLVTLTASNGHFTALLVKKSPFTPGELQRLESWGGSTPYFTLSASPAINGRGENAYQVFLGLGDPARERAFVRAYPFDIAPTDDNRPFFFRYSFWSHLFSDEPAVRFTSIPVMELSVLLLLVVVGLAAAGCVLLPLRALAADGLRVPDAGRWALYFAGTGIGYMAVEIAFLQKFGHFLGHPNYALSVVLAVLLLASGLGSLFSAALVRALGQVRFVTYVLAALILAEYWLLLPRLREWIALPFPLRALIVAALVFPVGFCLGVFVPTALDRLKGDGAAFAPWAWGINGIFSVLAPVLAVALSITWGINALLLSAIPLYLAVGWAFPAAAPSRTDVRPQDALTA
jgi:spermidine synthase